MSRQISSPTNSMSKIVVYVILTASLCYIAEGATVGDLFSSISRQGRLFFSESARLIRAETGRGAGSSPLTAEQEACIRNQTYSGFATFNRDFHLAMERLRREGPLLAPKLATTTPEQLDVVVKQRLDEKLQPLVQELIQTINNCTA